MFGIVIQNPPKAKDKKGCKPCASTMNDNDS
jgi:hypothetical protein